MLLTLDEILDFFARNQIPILPCYGITNGVCNCRKKGSCPSPGKHPLMKRWQMLATNDKSKIKAWIGTGRKSINLAISTGRRNPINGKYFTVVDLDQVEHPMLLRLEKSGKTITQRSGGGGDHAFYWSKMPIRNSCKLVEEKVDIRGHGGIVVIAPSMHASGKPYEFTCDLNTVEIQDFPEFLERKLKITISEKKLIAETLGIASKTGIKPKVLPEITKFWSKKTVPEIRVEIMNGQIVPIGVRNATMHRLLSSDRAKGASSKAKLISNAKKYLRSFEEPETFVEELEATISSVMSYPCYNNSHERVNELYLGWLSKKGYKPVHDLETLSAMDQRFFSHLEPISEVDGPITLCQIAQAREKFLRSQGLTKFATYRSQLLAKKLQGLGMVRTRTSKGNFWAVRFNTNPVQTMPPMCNTDRMETLEMVDELKDEEKKKGLKDGDVIDYNGEKVRVELIKTQTLVRVHSREHLYQGRTGYDYNKALMGLMPRLTDEMVDQMEQGHLVMDRNKTEDWMNQVAPGDILGVKSQRYKISDIPFSVFGNERSLNAIKVSPIERRLEPKPGDYAFLPDAEWENLSIGSIDHARELGLLDILWRDGKPFGEPDTKDMTVILLHPLDEEAKPSKKLVKGQPKSGGPKASRPKKK